MCSIERNLGDCSIKERKEGKTTIFIFLVADCRLNREQEEEEDASGDRLEGEEEDSVCVDTCFGG